MLNPDPVDPFVDQIKKTAWNLDTDTGQCTSATGSRDWGYSSHKDLFIGVLLKTLFKNFSKFQILHSKMKACANLAPTQCFRFLFVKGNRVNVNSYIISLTLHNTYIVKYVIAKL